MNPEGPQNSSADPSRPSLWTANPRLKFLSLLFVLVFLSCLVFIFVLAQVQKSYRQKIYVETQNALPHHQAKQDQVTLADGRLRVDEPKEGDAVGDTFEVSGYAQGWFEGAVYFEVSDDNGGELFNGTAIAPDNYDHAAYFKKEVRLDSTSTAPTGKIVFEDLSEKDGSFSYKRSLAIKFSNYTDQTGPETACKINNDCWCRSYDGTGFSSGKTPSSCDVKKNRCRPCTYE